MARKKKIDKDKELSLEEAQNVIKRLAHPKHINQEEKLLKEAAAVVLKETQPQFEFGDEEDADVKIDTASVDQTTSELTKPPGFFEQMGAQVSNLGAAGVIALASAAYFQVDTVVEETRTVATVAEEKWEEVKFEHPNINWDDPLAGFTTIIGVGDIEIDLEPPTPKEPTTTQASDSDDEVTVDEENETETEETETAIEETETEEADEPVEEEQEEKPKKKKKGLFGLFGGDDEEEAEEEETEEESEEPIEETEEESVDEESEESETVEEESSEPEPEAEEQVEEKPKKKSGGLFSFFTGGDDESDEQGEEPIDDEPSQTETTEEAEIEQQDETPDADTETETVENESGDDVKKSSGGGLFSRLFGNDNTEEVVEDSEVSTDEEPTIMVADSNTEEAPPLSVDEEPKVEVESIDAIDDIKPHADVMVTETEINDVEIEVVATDSGESFEINLSEMSEMDIEFISEAIDNGQLEVADLSIDDTIEETVEQVVIEQVLTPIDTGRGDVNVVSPATGGNIDWSSIFGPSAPNYDDGESDATPI